MPALAQRGWMQQPYSHSHCYTEGMPCYTEGIVAHDSVSRKLLSCRCCCSCKSKAPACLTAVCWIPNYTAIDKPTTIEASVPMRQMAHRGGRQSAGNCNAGVGSAAPPRKQTACPQTNDVYQIFLLMIHGQCSASLHQGNSSRDWTLLLPRTWSSDWSLPASMALQRPFWDLLA